MNPNLELLSSGDLFISILQLEHPQITDDTKIPSSITSIINDIIKKIDSQQIDFKLLRKNLLKENSDVYKVGLKSINLSIQYSYDLVQTLAYANFTGADSLYATSYLSLFIFLQFMATKYINDDLPLIFQILKKFLKTNDLRSILLSSYLELYKFYIESNSTLFVDEILRTTYDFYSHNLDLPKQSYLILGTTASKLFDRQNSTVSQPEIDFFSFIDMLAIERGIFFPNEVIEVCVKCLSMSLSQFDLFSVTFFAHFAERLSIKFSTTYFALFPLSISSFIMEKPPVTTIDIDSIKEQTNSSENELEKSGKANEIDFETSFVLPEQKPISQFIDTDVKNRLDLIIKSAEQKSELIKVFVDNFNDLLIKMIDSKYVFDFLAIIFEMTSYFSPVYNSLSLFETINKTPIFDQRVNILNQTDVYPTISSFRAAAFDFCCRNNFLSNFINANLTRPFILAEHLQRIIQCDFNFGDKQKTLIVKSAINAELQFQKQVTDSKGIQIARASIFVLLSRFLSNSSYSVKFFNDDWFCAVFILSFLFEKPLRSFVLSSTRNNLIIDPKKSPKVIRNYANVIDITSASLPSLESLDLISTILNMLNDVASTKPLMVDSLCIIREKVAKALSVLAQAIQKNQKKFDQKENNEKDLENNDLLMEKSRDFFIKSIQFFTQTSTIHQKTTSAYVSAFESIGSTLFTDNIPDYLFGRIVQLISGSLTPSFESSFIIREPKFVCFFLNFYKQDSNKFIESLSFIDKLCEFSRENCIICHKEKVDSYLIDYLVSKKEKYNPESKTDIDTVEQVLSLLCSIVSVVSSVSFVHQCFSLFTPICINNTKSISLLQPKFINTFSQIINKTGNNPSASFSLLSNGARIQFSLDQSLINKGFTFVFWICLDSATPQYIPSILQISDSGNQKINLYLKSNNLMFQITTKKTNSTGIFEKCIPFRSWTYVAVTFLKNPYSNDKDQVYITINEKYVKELNYPRIILNNGQIKFVLGGTTEGSTDSDNPALLATFGLFQALEASEINLLSELGPKLKEIPISVSKIKNDFNDSNESNIDDKLLVMVKTTNLNNQLKLDFVSTDSIPQNFGKIDMNSFKYIQPEIILKQKPSFTSVLLSSVKVDNLIPLFSQHDLNYINGEPYSPQCEELALLVLGSVLASSVDAQRSMYESKGFELICHLFTVSNSNHYTYKLYTKFFNLYQTLSFAPLQKQVFHSMLFNFDLLMKTTPIDHLLIIKHWNRSLFPAVLSHKIEKISFKQIITGLAVYYWSVKPQINCERPSELFDHLDIDKCRKCIINVAYQVAQSNFNDEDLHSLLSFMVNCNDVVLLEKLLSLLKSLVTINSLDNIRQQNPLENTKHINSELSLILYLLNHKEESIIADTFDILIIMINNKVISNITLAEMADIIIRQISPDIPTEILLQHINALMIDGTHELLSICMYFSLSIGIERLRKFIHSIQPSSLYFYHFSWSFWPITICYKLISIADQDSKSLIDEILTFLLECGNENWINIMVMIDFVGQVFSINPSDLKSKALTILCRIVLSAKESFETIANSYRCCIELLIRFLFFRSENESNESFNELFNSSLFSEPFEYEIDNKKAEEPQNIFKDKKYLLNAPRIHENFLKSNQSPGKYHFGLRLDNSGNWIDIDLAKYCVNIFLKYASSLIDNDSNYKLSSELISGPVLAIAAFMIRQNSDYISFIKPAVQLIQSNFENDENSNIQYYISYLEYSIKMAKNDDFYHIRNDSKQNANLAQHALEKLMNIELKEIFLNESQLPTQMSYFFESNWKKSIEIFSLLDDKIVLKASSIEQKFIIDIDSKRKENAKRWGRLWRSLALNERAPWYDGIDKIPVHWRRDFSACYMTIPFKLKRNWHFNEKSKESNTRNSTEITTDKMKSKENEIEANIDKKLDSTDLYENYEPIKDEKQIDSSNFGNLKGFYDCEIVKVTGTFQGKLYIYTELLSFVSNEKTKNIFLKDIRDIFLRNRAHLPTSIEIFMTNGRSYFINFKTVSGSQVISKLSKLSIPNLRQIQMEDMDSFFKINSLTEKWVSRKISNFEYIMHLNLMSGRSFNDLSQYPVFPWVIADYSSERLNLSSPKTYRDLSKPIGALNEEKLSQIKERAVQILEAEDKAYYYASGFLYPNLVIDFLYHIEPFTSLHNRMYINTKDNSLATFQSISKIWDEIKTIINDNWELIPEFYTTPEFLTNLSNFFNIENDENNSIRDTILPPWCSSSFDFVYKMRKALESEYVSRHLNEWIDLIWGVKQRSIEANNVFSPESYSDIWTKLEEEGENGDDDEKETIKATLLNMGQVPPQLFSEPHPTRYLKSYDKESWTVYTYKTDLQNIPAAFFTQSESKTTIVFVTPMIDKIYKCNLSRKAPKKFNSSVSRVKSSSDIKSKFCQLFDISFSAKEVKKKFTQAILDQKHVFSFMKPSTIIFSAAGSSEISLINVNNGHHNEISTPLSETSAIDCGSNYFVVACRNSVVNVYKFGCSFEAKIFSPVTSPISEKTLSLTSLDSEEQVSLKSDLSFLGISSSWSLSSNSAHQIASIASYRSKLPCVAISEQFNLIVNGTSDGFVVFSSLKSLAVEKIVQINDVGKPTLISISPSWGFVVVLASQICSGIITKFLLVFNVNGKLISKNKIDFNVACMTTFSDTSCFDQLLIADSTGNIYKSEIYSLDFSKPLYRCHDKIINLYYNDNESCIFAVSSNGNVYMIIHNFV